MPNIDRLKGLTLDPKKTKGGAPVQKSI